MRRCWAIADARRREARKPAAWALAVWALTVWARAAMIGVFGALTTAAVPASAADCSFGGCIDVANLPAGAGADMADILRRAQRFFQTSATAYIVSSDSANATLPYMLPRQEPFVMRHQIHIPEIYHARTEIAHLGKAHYVWHYILGHEMAHVYQEELGLIDAMTGPFKNQSVVLAELHADYMAGFFMAREFQIDAVTIDNLLKELKELPVGVKGSASYHGEPGERFFITTQGALAAFRRPTPSLADASALGVNCAFDLLFVRDGAKNLSEICR